MIVSCGLSLVYSDFLYIVRSPRLISSIAGAEQPDFPKEFEVFVIINKGMKRRRTRETN